MPELQIAPACQNCQSELPEGARFCDQCGYTVQEPQTLDQSPATDPAVLYLRGRTASEGEDYPGAIEYFSQAIQSNPN